MKKLAVIIKDIKDAPGNIGVMREVRVSVYDSEGLSHYYDRSSVISDVDNKASKLAQYEAIITMLNEASKEMVG